MRFVVDDLGRQVVTRGDIRGLDTMRSILPSRVLREGVEEVTFDPLDVEPRGLPVFPSERQRLGAHVDTDDPSGREAVLEEQGRELLIPVPRSTMTVPGPASRNEATASSHTRSVSGRGISARRSILRVSGPKSTVSSRYCKGFASGAAPDERRQTFAFCITQFGLEYETRAAATGDGTPQSFELV